MSIAQLAQAIGKTALLRTEGFLVHITINDVKQPYGNIRYYVTPVRGSGSAWVDESRVTNIGGTNA